jgi:DNA polymerase alpha subunit A
MSALEANKYAQFSALRKDAMALPPDLPNALKSEKLQVEICNSEWAMLNYLMAKMQVIDADVIVGHNFIGFDLDVLLHRMQAHSIGNWSRLGRLRRSK